MSRFACEILLGNHRTPLLNSISDLYPILDFIKHSHAESKKIFKEKAKDLSTLLSGTMIRPTYATEVFSRKLVDLP